MVLLSTWVQLISLLSLVVILIIFRMPSQVLKRFSLFSRKKLLNFINEYFNRIILQSHHTCTHIYTVISEVLHKKLYKIKI